MKVNIIGHGNVGFHLAQAFSGTGEVNRVSARTLEGLDTTAELSVIAVPDRFIGEVALRLSDLDGIVAHTSGSTSIEAIVGKVKRPGVFYPLQTFSKERTMDYSTLPFFIEAVHREDRDLLMETARKISTNVSEADSATRRKLHLAAVFANNFTNHMVTLGQTLLEEEGIDPTLLNPLISETVSKLDAMKGMDAQTGPARRGDDKTIAEHLRMLEGHPEARRIYEVVSESIEKMYKS